MIDIVVIDRYSGDTHTYSSKFVEVDMETKALVLDDCKVKLFKLDRVRLSVSDSQ